MTQDDHAERKGADATAESGPLAPGPHWEGPSAMPPPQPLQPPQSLAPPVPATPTPATPIPTSPTLATPTRTPPPGPSDPPPPSAPPAPPAPPAGAWQQPPAGAWQQPPAAAWQQPAPGYGAPPAQPGWAPGAWPPAPQPPAYPPPGPTAWPGATAWPTGTTPAPGAPAWPGATAWPGAAAWPGATAWPGAAPGWPVAGPIPWPLPMQPAGPFPGIAWAGVAVRLGALMLDTIIAAVAFVIASLIASAFSTRGLDGRIEYEPAGYAIIWLCVLAVFLYQPLCWWRLGATLGQRALGLRIVRDSDGLPLHLGAVIMRYVVWFVLMLTVVLAIIAAVVAAENPAKRGWHDEASGSVVIKRIG
jgi:uncharacterized RDD family membrane protein YckC